MSKKNLHHQLATATCRGVAESEDGSSKDEDGSFRIYVAHFIILPLPAAGEGRGEGVKVSHEQESRGEL